MPKKSSSNYQKAFENLENIYNELREGNIEIDQLDKKLKSALEYIKTCKKVLDNQQESIKDILKEIER